MIELLRPQVGELLISANRNLDAYRCFGYPVAQDLDPSFAGPLAGLASAMLTAGTEYVVVVPCDCPLLPPDLVAVLAAALERDQADISVAHDGERMQPVVALLRQDLLPNLQACLRSGERKMALWLARHRVALADFSSRPEIFFNVNTPLQRAELEARWAALKTLVETNASN
jgi:molybdenum cofactor guanylyltransferase